MSESIEPCRARCWAEVDLGAIVANARTVASVSQSRLMPMLKANGYGLGAIEVARALESVSPWGYGVATAAEGKALRSAGISRPILVCTPFVSGDIEAYLAADLRPTIGDLPALDSWLNATDRPYHLEIDTGMGRAGVPWHETELLAAVAARAGRSHGWEGVFTHFHSAEDDPAATAAQWERFEGVLSSLPRRPGLVHAANSAAALQGPRYAGDLVRPGIFLYGGRASASHEPAVAVRLEAPVVAVRRVRTGDTVSYGATWHAPEPGQIATLGVGYADGVPRALSGRAAVELAGRRMPIAGRVTMDLTMVAVPEGSVQVGDVAVIYGGLVSLDEQAYAAGTIAYELLTALGGRVPRHYRRTS